MLCANLVFVNLRTNWIWIVVLVESEFVCSGSSVSVEAETTDLRRKEEAMMQPRDAHDDGDCAMEEAGGHSSPLPPVMTTKTHDASSPSSNHHDGEMQRTASPMSVADAALVGARKRKAIRVVKHQQVSL